MGTEFPWRWGRGTISANLDVIWGMSVKSLNMSQLPLHRIRSRAGIRDVQLHDLRHSFASHAVLRGIPLPVVSRMLGHKRPSMTLRYAHVGDRETEAAAECIGTAISRALGGRDASSSD